MGKKLSLKIAGFICICSLYIIPSVSAAPKWVSKILDETGNPELIGKASAIILENSTTIKISDDGSAKQHSRKAIRILNSQSIRLASIFLPISDIVEVKGLEGWRIEQGGTEHKLDKKNIVEIGLEQATGYYTDRQTLVALFPDAQPGDVIAFEYTMKEKKGVEGLFQSFQFQDSLPILAVSFEVNLPSGWKLFSSSQNLKPITVNHSGRLYRWTAINLAYRPEEPYMPRWRDVVRSIEVSAHNPNEQGTTQFSDWEDVSRWAYELYESRAIGNDSLKTMVAKVTRGLTTTEDKVMAIARYVRDNIRYVAVEIGVGRFQPRDANATLSNRFGDCKDKATLMSAMLSEIGVSSKPVLALSGGDVAEGMPSPFQFNHCIVSFPVKDAPQLKEYKRAQADGWFYFDPTDPSTEPGHLPGSLQGSYVLPMAIEKSTLVNLPERKPEEHRTRYLAKASLVADHSVKATVRITYYGNRASAESYTRRSQTYQEQIDDFRDDYLSSMNEPIINNYAVNSDRDSLWVTFDLVGSDYLQQSGNMSMLKADFFHSDTKNRLKRTKTRVHPVWFGPTGSYETIVDWSLPSGWRFNNDPDTVLAECDIAKLTYNLSGSNDSLRFYSYREYYGGTLKVEKYKQARKYNRKRSTSFSTRIIIAESE